MQPVVYDCPHVKEACVEAEESVDRLYRTVERAMCKRCMRWVTGPVGSREECVRRLLSDCPHKDRRGR